MNGAASAVAGALVATVLVLPLGVALLGSVQETLTLSCDRSSAPADGLSAGAEGELAPSPQVAAVGTPAVRTSLVECDRAPAASAVGGGAAGPVAYTGGRTGCVLPDPTGTGGCVAGSTWHLLEQVRVGWGAWPGSCWDEHAWNPRSDHPRGLACDFTVGRLGRRPSAQERARGWGLAEWLLAGADRLAVRYVIFDGLFCPAGGACRPYGGGGVYDPESVTGGHFDHVHVSLRDGNGTA
ncbi:MAG: hypothetical protein M3P95_10140 [Actinomycetota bacterium]|nr:hypothetical protein [Actinomycetota bacterium]